MNVSQASCILVKRYIELLKSTDIEIDTNPDTSVEHLIKMCEAIIEESNQWPDDKTSRWLGYIQGVMCVYNIINVSKERYISRELFHKVYEDNNISIPKSIKV